MAFRITQGDSSPAITSTLTDGQEPIDLSNTNDVRFIMEDRYERVQINEGITGATNYVDAANGEVEYIFSSDDTATAGTYYAEWEVRYQNGAIETFPVENKIRVEIIEEIA